MGNIIWSRKPTAQLNFRGLWSLTEVARRAGLLTIFWLASKIGAAKAILRISRWQLVRKVTIRHMSLGEHVRRKS